MAITGFVGSFCEHCSGIGTRTYLECSGFTTSGVRFICPNCGIVEDFECEHCETCKLVKDCDMRNAPKGQPTITARGHRSQFFGDFINYEVKWGNFYYTCNQLEHAIQARNDVVSLFDETCANATLDASYNMPCDTYGACACNASCPRYFQCGGDKLK